MMAVVRVIEKIIRTNFQILIKLINYYRDNLIEMQNRRNLINIDYIFRTLLCVFYLFINLIQKRYLKFHHRKVYTFPN